MRSNTKCNLDSTHDEICVKSFRDNKSSGLIDFLYGRRSPVGVGWVNAKAKRITKVDMGQSVSL